MLPLLVLLQNELVGNESDDLSKTMSFRLNDHGLRAGTHSMRGDSQEMRRCS